jgi:AsmA protein
VDINTDLTNSQTIVNALSGNIRMRVVDGAIVGIDVMNTLKTVNSLLGKQKETEGKGGQDQKTEFAELSMSGVFNQGVMTSDDLIMQSPVLKATGEGSFSLVEESIDYRLNPVLSGESGVESLDALSGYAIPIKLTGNLYEPDFKIDIAAAIVGSQKEAIGKKANDLLGGLLGGSKKKKKNKDKDGGGGGFH